MYIHSSRVQNPKTAPIKTVREETSVPIERKYVIGFIIGIILLIPTYLIAHTHQLTGLQARIFFDFDNLPNGYKTLTLIVTEGLGSAYPIAICVLAAVVFKRYRLAWRFAFTAGGAAAVAEIIKKLVNEPRPIVMLHGHLHQRAVETGPGFPSGHATAATALALTLWLILPRKWRWLPILWILTVAVSRLYLGIHTPADIVGGFAIGLMAVCFVQLLPRNLARKIYLYNMPELLKKGR
jgi:membrane-associated phospholipid phosphatase